MPVIVKQFQVVTKKKTYLPGDLITELSKEEEKELVERGYCEYPTVINKKANASSDEISEEETLEPEDIAEDESEEGPDTSHPLDKQKGKGKGGR
jgi:hypothetical protein